MSNALEVQNVGKAYLLKHDPDAAVRYLSLRDAIGNSFNNIFSARKDGKKFEEVFWALDNISFNVAHGEKIGIIGRNGAGKSTLLKIIARITTPSRGRLKISGHVASLLEVGTGFHPELTGRENIFLNGSILGMSRSDIRLKFDEIVSFAEVERFLDTPVKRYSSGMYMRLAFAVAAHLEPEILIVDEVLAVGDAAFQKKCLGKMEEVGQEGRTVLFVSHNMGAISEFCDRAILLNQGLILADGTPKEIIPMYSGKSPENHSGIKNLPINSSAECSITSIAFTTSDSGTRTVFDSTEDIGIEISFLVRERLSELQITITISRDGIDIFHAFDNDAYDEIIPTYAGSYMYKYIIPKMVLKEGSYTTRITAGMPHKLIQDINSNLHFEVISQNINMSKKSYRHDRTGYVISPGTWAKIKLNQD